MDRGGGFRLCRYHLTGRTEDSMKIRDLWNRIKARFKKHRDEGTEPADQGPVIQLEPAPAPEPEPERKTSDEMIITMADEAAGTADPAIKNEVDDEGESAKT